MMEKDLGALVNHRLDSSIECNLQCLEQAIYVLVLKMYLLIKERQRIISKNVERNSKT